MKFTDGFWQTRPGVTTLYATEAYDLVAGENSLVVTAPTRVIESRGDTLNRPALTVTLTSPLEGIIGVKIEHFQGGAQELGFDLVGEEPGHGEVTVSDASGTISSGELRATVSRGAPWDLSFSAGERVLTSSGAKSAGYIPLAPGAQVASILAAAGWPDSRQPVVIIGHQPALGRLASLLLFGVEQDLSIRKGAAWWLTNRSREDNHITTLRAAICPDYL